MGEDGGWRGEEVEARFFSFELQLLKVNWGGACGYYVSITHTPNPPNVSALANTRYAYDLLRCYRSQNIFKNPMHELIYCRSFFAVYSRRLFCPNGVLRSRPATLSRRLDEFRFTTGCEQAMASLVVSIVPKTQFSHQSLGEGDALEGREAVCLIADDRAAVCEGHCYVPLFQRGGGCGQGQRGSYKGYRNEHCEVQSQMDLNYLLAKGIFKRL